MLSFYICLLRMTIIWCIMYGSWDMEFNRKNLFSFWTIFCPFTEKSKFKKKKPGDIISLHLCTTNDNHMMYGSLDIRCNRKSFLWTILCPFAPPSPPSPKNLKNQNFDKMKKSKTKKKLLEILSFVPLMHKWKSFDVFFLRYDAWQTYLSFWAIFCPFTPLTTQRNQNFEKIKKNLEISSF